MLLVYPAFACIHSQHLSKYPNQSYQKIIKNINTLMRNFISGKEDMSQEFQEQFLDKHGMLWTREYGKSEPNCQEMDKILPILNVGHMVIGHTPQMDGISSSCNSKIWKVDVGISKVFGDNQLQVLEIWDNGVPVKSNQMRPIRILV